MEASNIHNAKSNLSRLVDAALSGEDVVIAKAGKPVVRLVPIKPARKRIRFGAMRGAIKIAPDFDAPLPDEVLGSFEGG